MADYDEVREKEKDKLNTKLLKLTELENMDFVKEGRMWRKGKEVAFVCTNCGCISVNKPSKWLVCFWCKESNKMEENDE